MKTLTDIEKLREIALDQHGMVTSLQAKEIGVSLPSLSYLVKNNRIERIERGIYRIPQVQSSENDRIQQALLWAGDDSVISYDTALLAWDVCDINPVRIHISVPKKRRIKKAGGDGVVIHKEDIDQKQLRWWDGMPVYSLETAIEQTINRGVSSHIVEQAIDNGTARGLITASNAKVFREKLRSRER